MASLFLRKFRRILRNFACCETCMLTPLVMASQFGMAQQDSALPVTPPVTSPSPLDVSHESIANPSLSPILPNKDFAGAACTHLAHIESWCGNETARTAPPPVHCTLTARSVHSAPITALPPVVKPTFCQQVALSCDLLATVSPIAVLQGVY